MPASPKILVVIHSARVGKSLPRSDEGTLSVTCWRGDRIEVVSNADASFTLAANCIPT